MSVRPAKTQISLGICPVWSVSSLCAQWVAKDPGFLYADNEDSDQTGRMPWLIWVFAGRTLISSPEQCSRRAIVLPPVSASALALASVSTNVKSFTLKVFRTSLFPNLMMDLVHVWYDDGYWSKILQTTIPTPIHDLKVKVTDLELLC